LSAQRRNDSVRTWEFTTGKSKGKGVVSAGPLGRAYEVVFDSHLPTRSTSSAKREGKKKSVVSAGSLS
jgi:hypothetical protein